MTDRKIITAAPASNEALFRYLLVGQIVRCMQSGASRSKAIRFVAREAHATFDGRMRRVSERTLHRWVVAFELQGYAGLERKGRSPCRSSLVIPEPLVSFAASQKELDPRASIPEIIERAREFGFITPEQPIDRTTFYRVLKRAGVPVTRRKAAKKGGNGLRFAYPHRMQMILCDGKHFRAGVTRAKRVALFFLDDATRYGFDVVVGTSENALLFLEGLHAVVRQYGFFSILYLDQGPGFIHSDTIEVVRNLDALLIHGTKAYPQGHGKIEKFNQTALSRVLRGLDRRPDVDPDCQALTLRLRHWLKKRYNHKPHESLENHQPPHERFHSDSAALRFPESEQDLEHRFVLYLSRRVSADNVVPIFSVDYEMPRGYGGARVILHRRVLDSTFHFVHNGRLIELHPVDLYRNATTPRTAVSEPPEIERPLPPSAADLHFQRDMKPIVGPDGGFCINPAHKED